MALTALLPGGVVLMQRKFANYAAALPVRVRPRGEAAEAATERLACARLRIFTGVLYVLVIFFNVMLSS